MKKIKLIIVLASLCLLLPNSASAHGGGLDGSGCHTKRATGEYHCHRGSPSNDTQSSLNRQSRHFTSIPSAAGQYDSTCHVGPRGGRYRIINGRKRYDC